MAEIRKNTLILDDFNRADEATLAGPNWVLADSGAWQSQLFLKTGAVTEGAAVHFSASCWNPLSLDGDDAEAWATAVGGNAPGIGWYIGLVKDIGGTNAIDGYFFRMAVSTGGGRTDLFRFNNGGSTLLNGNTANPPTGGGWIGLIRRNGTSVEGWASQDGGATWTLYVSAVDTSFTTGLKPMLGISENAGDNLTFWDDFGAGPAVLYVPQMFRHYRTLRV